MDSAVQHLLASMKTKKKKIILIKKLKQTNQDFVSGTMSKRSYMQYFFNISVFFIFDHFIEILHISMYNGLFLFLY
jgi:hypothetical protein